MLYFSNANTFSQYFSQTDKVITMFESYTVHLPVLHLVVRTQVNT